LGKGLLSFNAERKTAPDCINPDFSLAARKSPDEILDHAHSNRDARRMNDIDGGGNRLAFNGCGDGCILLRAPRASEEVVVGDDLAGFRSLRVGTAARRRQPYAAAGFSRILRLKARVGRPIFQLWKRKLGI
jgi:hypothetical protein